MPRPGQYKDITNKRYGRLVAIEFLIILPGRRTMWRMQCDCGNIVDLPYRNFRDGNTESCGCKKQDILLQRITKHGLGKTSPLYKRWKNIRQRCLNPKHPRYQDYGGRGITLWPTWQDFGAFSADIVHEIGWPNPGDTLDRKNNDKGYEPGNIRWATKKEQNRNSRKNRPVTFEGKTQTLWQWAEELEVPYRKLYDQFWHRRWPPQPTNNNT